MQFIVLKADNLQSLAAKLVATPQGGGAASPVLERLKKLNPHVADFGQLSAGTVLFLPDDAPELADPRNERLEADAFEALTTDLEAGLKAAAVRVKAAAERTATDQADVGATLKTAAMKRLAESDAELKAQLEAVTAQFAKDQRGAQEAVKLLELLQKNAAGEMGVLGKVVG